jgi:hypothetical protein
LLSFDAKIFYLFSDKIVASCRVRMVGKNCDSGLVGCEAAVRARLRRSAVSGFLEKSQLIKLRLKAMRAGVWFRRLARIDRVLIDLTIKVAGSVRSFILAENVLSVVRKLDCLMENRLSRAVREVGLPVARRLGLLAQSWGNVAAGAWVRDVGFARYWAAMSLNERRLFGG